MTSRQGMSLALVTGAASGIGLAVSRCLGMTHEMILTDLNEERLGAAKASLEADGVTVVGAIVGALQNKDVLDRVEALLLEGRSLDVLVHSAGLSPMQADWRTSAMVNIVATRQLVEQFGPRMAPFGVAILLSSLAAYAAIPVTEADAIVEKWQESDFYEQLAPLIEALPEEERSGRCYVLAKKMVVRLCESLAPEWGARGVRIMSISPGVVDTPMGRKEVAESRESACLLNFVPLGGFVKPNDIAEAVGFFASPQARFITGIDIKIDGGLQAAISKGGH